MTKIVLATVMLSLSSLFLFAPQEQKQIEIVDVNDIVGGCAFPKCIQMEHWWVSGRTHPSQYDFPTVASTPIKAEFDYGRICPEEQDDDIGAREFSGITSGVSNCLELDKYSTPFLENQVLSITATYNERVVKFVNCAPLDT